MKIVSNLPGNLRALFGLLRILTLIMGVFWLLVLSYNTWIQNRTGHDARLMVSVGEISLPAAPGSVGLRSDTATPGSLVLQSLRGTLQVDLCSSDARLVSALRLAIIPSMVGLIIFLYVLFGALHRLCANLEAGAYFNEENCRLARRLGLALIVYSLLSIFLEILASAVLGGYFSAHVGLTGLATVMPFGSGPAALKFNLVGGFMTNPGGLVTGCVVLMVAEAFRQGLKLKTENDLTV